MNVDQENQQLILQLQFNYAFFTSPVLSSLQLLSQQTGCEGGAPHPTSRCLVPSAPESFTVVPPPHHHLSHISRVFHSQLPVPGIPAPTFFNWWAPDLPLEIRLYILLEASSSFFAESGVPPLPSLEPLGSSPHQDNSLVFPLDCGPAF